MGYFMSLTRFFIYVILVFTNLASVNVYADDTQVITLGVGVHLWGRNKVEIDKQLDAASKANLKIIRWDAPWKAVEQEKGKLEVPANWDYIVDSAKAKGIESLIILDYGNKFYDNGDKPLSDGAVSAYVKYSAFLVDHFKGRVKYFQVWNEWNGRVGNTTPGKAKDYAKLLKAVYPVLKAIDNNIYVIGGSFSSSSYDSILGLRVAEKHMPTQFQFFLGEDVADYMDAISIHPYVVYRDGDMHTFSGFIKLINSVVSRIRATPGYEIKPIMITELGWSTAIEHPKGVSEQEQANLLANAIRELDNLGVDSLIIYELVDGNGDLNDPEGNFGLFRRDWSEKPAINYIKSNIEKH
jgi:polysaccharide biosynthesis protein PslG